MTPQAVGALGEKVVEAELLRRGWMPANVNATVKNAARFDVYALKGSRSVQLRIKTCGPSRGEFLIARRTKEPDCLDSDFTVLVRVGAQRADDLFYVVPSQVICAEVERRRTEYLSRTKRDGGRPKDIGMWTLRLRPRKDGRTEGGWDLAKKWKRYRENWELLEQGRAKGR